MIKKRSIQLFFFASMMIFVLVACNKKSSAVEVISMEELLGEDDPVEKQDDSKKLEIPELDGTFVSEINQELYKDYTSKAHSKSTLIDRFSAKSIEKTVFVSKKDSLSTTDFYMYSFADTTSTMNAFNNLLACFGSKCEEISLLVSKSRVEEQVMWCGVFQTSIVILKFSEKAFSSKDALKQTIFQTKGEALKYTLNVDRNRELEWD